MKNLFFYVVVLYFSCFTLVYAEDVKVTELNNAILKYFDLTHFVAYNEY